MGSSKAPEVVINAIWKRVFVSLVISMVYSIPLFVSLGYFTLYNYHWQISIFLACITVIVAIVTAFISLPIVCCGFYDRHRYSFAEIGMGSLVCLITQLLVAAETWNRGVGSIRISLLLALVFAALISLLVCQRMKFVEFKPSDMTMPVVPTSLWHSILSLIKAHFSRDIISSMQLGLINVTSLILLRKFCLGNSINIATVACDLLRGLVTATLLVMVAKFSGEVLALTLLYPLDFSLLQERLEKPSLAVNSKSGSEALMRQCTALNGVPPTKADMFSWNVDGANAIAGNRLRENMASSSGRNLRDTQSMNSRNYWQEILKMHNEFADSLLARFKPTTAIGVPVVAVFQNKDKVSVLESLVRLLALHDFNRIARGVSTSSLAARRRGLFCENSVDWSQLAHASCSLMDAATLQLQLVVAFGVVDVLPDLNQSTAAHTDKYSRERRSHTLPHNWKGSAVAETTALSIVLANRKRRESDGVPMVSSAIQKISDACFGHEAWRRTEDTLLQPLPKLLAQTLVLAVESVSLTLTSALKDDSRGCSIHYLPTVLSSLIALKCVLQEHREVAQEYCLCAPTRAHRSLSSFPRHGELGSAVPTNLLAVSIAVDEALDRLLRSYHDQIRCYPFPPAYANILEKKLACL